LIEVLSISCVALGLQNTRDLVADDVAVSANDSLEGFGVDGID
jgi:hypothetical protein